MRTKRILKERKMYFVPCNLNIDSFSRTRNIKCQRGNEEPFSYEENQPCKERGLKVSFLGGGGGVLKTFFSCFKIFPIPGLYKFLTHRNHG